MVNVTLGVTLSPNLKNDERKVLVAIDNNFDLNRNELSIIDNKTTKTIQRVVNNLVDKGCLLRIGNNRFGYY